MATVLKLKEIKAISNKIDVIAAMEEGFIKYSNDATVVPPVAEMLFEDPPGDVHIKYGYIKEDEFYCIKIASGFYDNPKLGIASAQGMMLLFSQNTGRSEAILLDEGHLTDIRTAAAGALAAKYFAPKKIKAIGVVGTGGQGKLQVKYLQQVTSCKKVWIKGRTTAEIDNYIAEMGSDYDFHIAKDTAELAEHCNLIVTTTPSENPLLFAKDIRPGTHITAMGSDTAEKQELEGEILNKADLVIADSIPQSKSRGEIFKAVKAKKITPEKVRELGKAIQDPALCRTDENQISVVDLTGVAVQDIMIANAVYGYHKNKNNNQK